MIIYLVVDFSREKKISSISGIRRSFEQSNTRIKLLFEARCVLQQVKKLQTFYLQQSTRMQKRPSRIHLDIYDEKLENGEQMGKKIVEPRAQT